MIDSLNSREPSDSHSQFSRPWLPYAPHVYVNHSKSKLFLRLKKNVMLAEVSNLSTIILQIYQHSNVFSEFGSEGRLMKGSLEIHKFFQVHH